MLKNSNTILSELLSISPKLTALPKDNPFDAPAGYFSQFSTRIMAKINLQDAENEELSPLLQSLQKVNPFVAPPSYLDQFKVPIAQQEAKVVQLFSLKTVLKYAVAASLIGIIVTFATLFFNSEEKNQLVLSNSSSSISSDAFALYLKETGETETTAIEPIIDDESSLLVQMDAALVREILKEIPENEISNYIDLFNNEDLKMMN